MGQYQFGTKSDETLALQITLARLNLYTGHLDGIFGAKTRDAVMAAQDTYGIAPADGVVRAPLLLELGIVTPKPVRKPGFFEALALLFTLNTSKGKLMKWSTIEQIIRIAAYSGGGLMFGQKIADGDTFQAAIGGLIAVGAFVWWWFFERNRLKE